MKFWFCRLKFPHQSKIQETRVYPYLLLYVSPDILSHLPFFCAEFRDDEDEDDDDNQNDASSVNSPSGPVEVIQR